MNTKNSRFGSKGVFRCITCERNTRETGDGVDDQCHQCFEIAGLDNQVNDEGHATCPADILAICEDHLARIVALGGNAENVRGSNTFIWAAGQNENNSTEAVAELAQIEDVKPAEETTPVITTNSRRAKMSKSRAMSKAQKTLNLVSKMDGKIKPGELVAKIQSMCKFPTERAARTYLHNARQKIKKGTANVTPARKRSNKKAVAASA